MSECVCLNPSPSKSGSCVFCDCVMMNYFCGGGTQIQTVNLPGWRRVGGWCFVREVVGETTKSGNGQNPITSGLTNVHGIAYGGWVAVEWGA